MPEKKVQSSLDRLKNHIEANSYLGWDPYDGLTSPLFRLPVLRSNKTIRFLAQQAIKRSPVNLRPLLGIRKAVNPVTLGLCIQGYAYLSQVFPADKEAYRRKVLELSDNLILLSPYFNPELNLLSTLHSPLFTRDTYSGACWGYPFDWQARNAAIPAFQPTVVATGIIVHALFEAWHLLGLEKCRELIVSAADFVLNDLNRTYDRDTFCFSYSPFDQQQVLNASMKGARILVQAAASVSSHSSPAARHSSPVTRHSSPVTRHLSPVTFTLNDNYTEPAKKAASFVIMHQHMDGSFPYSLAKGGGWSDSYHTGYVLDCLEEYIRLTGDESKMPELTRGFGFFKENFIADGRIPKINAGRTYPVDCTAAGQVILTLCRFGEFELAGQVASWTIDHMQSTNGHFYYKRPTANGQRPTDFMRWSDAWMFAALAFLLKSTEHG